MPGRGADPQGGSLGVSLRWPQISATSLPGQALAKLREAGNLEEDDCTHRFTASPVLINDKLVAVLHKDSPELAVYSGQISDLKLCPTLRPVCDGKSEFSRTAVTIRQNSRMRQATIEVEFQTPQKQLRRIALRTQRRGHVCQDDGRRGRRAASQCACRFAVLPDFFGDDMLVDAAALPMRHQAETPSENFLLQMVPGGNSIVMTVSES